jgi:hypothetical protein
MHAALRRVIPALLPQLEGVCKRGRLVHLISLRHLPIFRRRRCCQSLIALWNHLRVRHRSRRRHPRFLVGWVGERNREDYCLHQHQTHHLRHHRTRRLHHHQTHRHRLRQSTATLARATRCLRPTLLPRLQALGCTRSVLASRWREVATRLRRLARQC